MICPKENVTLKMCRPWSCLIEKVTLGWVALFYSATRNRQGCYKLTIDFSPKQELYHDLASHPLSHRFTPIIEMLRCKRLKATVTLPHDIRNENVRVM